MICPRSGKGMGALLKPMKRQGQNSVTVPAAGNRRKVPKAPGASRGRKMARRVLQVIQFQMPSLKTHSDRSTLAGFALAPRSI